MKLSDLKAGQTIYLDEAFTCRKPGAAVVLEDEKGALFIECEDGNHYLDGQVDDLTGELVGISNEPFVTTEWLTRETQSLYRAARAANDMPTALACLNQLYGLNLMK